VIQARIHSLNIDATTNQPVIILRDPDTGRLLPIWIGHAEATAILLALQRIEPPRPMTHDLLVSIVRDLGFVVERIEITRLEESTFFAALIVRGEERTLAIDARPSDSMAVAVRVNAPILVAEAVFDEAGLMPEEGYDEEAEVERFRDFLENVDPGDFLS
jgi:bifunctional DNase/RNase